MFNGGPQQGEVLPGVQDREMERLGLATRWLASVTTKVVAPDQGQNKMKTQFLSAGSYHLTGTIN